MHAVGSHPGDADTPVLSASVLCPILEKQILGKVCCCTCKYPCAHFSPTAFSPLLFLYGKSAFFRTTLFPLFSVSQL